MVSAMFIENDLTLSQKIARLNWWLILLICCVASVGIASLYSAAGGSMEPWASRQLVRFGVGLVGIGFRLIRTLAQ